MGEFELCGVEYFVWLFLLICWFSLCLRVVESHHVGQSQQRQVCLWNVNVDVRWGCWCWIGETELEWLGAVQRVGLKVCGLHVFC